MEGSNTANSNYSANIISFDDTKSLVSLLAAPPPPPIIVYDDAPPVILPGLDFNTPPL